MDQFGSFLRESKWTYSYGQSSAQWPSPNTLSPATATAAAAPVHSTASNAADRRQLPLVPPPRAGVGVGAGNGWRLVRFWPWIK
ncbi:hypothetical protein DAI22_11g082001 [Oryza sativa Japonica Group]|nr:hypothetical protein DAI22_11g082001 [Oryza sativa Japonica Group]